MRHAKLGQKVFGEACVRCRCGVKLRRILRLLGGFNLRAQRRVLYMLVGAGNFRGGDHSPVLSWMLQSQAGWCPENQAGLYLHLSNACKVLGEFRCSFSTGIDYREKQYH